MGVLGLGFDRSLIDVEKMVEDWTADVRRWRHVGLLSGVGENLGSFVNKKSVVVDDSVFLLSNSLVEMPEVG